MTVSCIIQQEATNSALGITTNTTLAGGTNFSKGMIGKVVVQTSGTAAGAILDSTSTTPSAANTIWAGTFTAGASAFLSLNWPTQNGLTIIPAGATLNVSWS
jgi:hypothetical protein